MSEAYQKVVVVGMGITGMACARFWHARGANVIVSDARSKADLAPQLDSLQQMGVQAELGGHQNATFQHADLVCISPGVPHDIEPLRQARACGIPVLGEIELASRLVTAPMIAVTGTNGKTTTTLLLGEMLSAAGMRPFVGGNVGNPLIDYVDGDQDADVVVLEVSSFQLDTIETFHPDVALLLNVTPDHLDRYAGFGAYAASKKRIFENQNQTDTAIFNAGDTTVAKLVADIQAQRLPYCHCNDQMDRLQAGAIVCQDHLDLYTEGRLQRLDLSKTVLNGRHNHENIAAAALAALVVGAAIDGIQIAVDQFKGLAHRLETVASIAGVRYINDSKATNVDAVRSALMAQTRPVVLIMGGLSKDDDFEVLMPLVSDRVHHLIVLGDAADRILQTLGGLVGHTRVDAMAAAVATARVVARPGDVVLLAPACASFDMYANYAERGEDFRNNVAQLESSAADLNPPITGDNP